MEDNIFFFKVVHVIATIIKCNSYINANDDNSLDSLNGFPTGSLLYSALLYCRNIMSTTVSSPLLGMLFKIAVSPEPRRFLGMYGGGHFS